MTYYKAFASDGRTLHGRPAWPLPHGKRPGKWVTVDGELVPCKNGLHVMRECDLQHWPGWHLYEVEVSGEVVESDNKVVARKARLTRKVSTWTDRTLYAWLADCVESVRAFGRGEIMQEQMRAAANAAKVADAAADAAALAANATYAAANSAAADAAANAAKVADAAADAAALAANATYAAANSADADADASYAAADAAANARSAERAWQAARMLAYINGEVQP